jgi:hypothetical protein
VTSYGINRVSNQYGIQAPLSHHIEFTDPTSSTRFSFSLFSASIHSLPVSSNDDGFLEFVLIKEIELDLIEIKYPYD